MLTHQTNSSDSLLLECRPDASEKDVTPRNQTHALKRRTGRMPCAYSFRRGTDNARFQFL